MQQQEYMSHTVADELWENFHALTPQYCFHQQGKNQYICTLQKKEFVFETRGNVELFCRKKGENDDESLYKLVAVTMTQSFTNHMTKIPVELGLDDKPLGNKNVQTQGELYHEVIFPGTCNEKKILFQSQTSTNPEIIELVSRLKAIQKEGDDIWHGAVQTKEDNTVWFLPIKTCVTIVNLYSLVERKQFVTMNREKGYTVTSTERYAMEKYISNFKDGEPVFRWDKLSIKAVTPLSHEKTCMFRVQVYYYEE